MSVPLKGIWLIRLRLLVPALLICLSTIGLQAQDAQWRGLDRNGIYPDKGLLKAWPEEGPELLLRIDSIGNGYSTPVFEDGSIFITGRKEEIEILSRLDMNGALIWQTEFGRAWEGSFRESRATPCIEEGRVYITGGMGNVVCLDARTGEIIWERNTHDEFGGTFHKWGYVESVVLYGQTLISSPIGDKAAVLGLDKMDGSLLWNSASVNGVRSYASPIIMPYGEKDLLLVCSSEELVCLDPAKGEILWTQDLLDGYTGERGRRNNTNTPLYKGSEILVSSGYDADALMLSLSEDGASAHVKWHNSSLDVHHGGLVLIDGYLYGANWISNGKGNWVCQEWETGKVMWEESWYNKGSIISADGLLYIFEEKHGHVGLLKPDPTGFSLLSTFQLESSAGPRWAHMSIYDQKLFIRHGEKLFVYDIKAGDHED